MREDGQKTGSGRREAGFTLLELIVVIVILGMLAAVVGPNIYKKMGQSKDQIAIIQLSQLDGALKLYSFDVGRFPSSAEGLQALVQNPTGGDSWNGPYLEKGVPDDPWGRPYAYKSPGDHGEFDLYSFGADGEEGSDDDICSWK